MLINKFTGRKNSKLDQIKAKSKDDHAIKWYEHFKKLLWSNLNINNEDNLKTISGINMNIETGQFTSAEYVKLKER